MLIFVFVALAAVTVIVALLMVILLARKYYLWRFSPLNELPGPKSSFILGCLLDIQKEPFMAPHKRWWKEAGDVPLIHYTTVLGKHHLAILDADIVKEILTAPAGKNPPRFPKRLVFLRKTIGNGLVTLDGEDWSRHRRTIQPSFQVGFLKAKLSSTVPSLTDKLIACWRKAEGREIDVASHFSAITLDIIGDVAFSHAFHAMDVVEEWAFDSDSKGLAEVSDPLINSLLVSMKPDPVRFMCRLAGLGSIHDALDFRTRRTEKLLNEAVDSVVNKARGELNTDGNTPSPRGAKSLLELLFDAKDTEPGAGARTLSHKELRDETKTFLIAGHETTATLSYWAFFALARHKDLQQRVYEDIVKHAPGNGDGIDLEAIEKMMYFSAFLNEVLRLYAPVGMMLRYNAAEEHFAGHVIPKDTRLVIAPHLLHRHPSYWEDPLEFKPERWLNKDAMKRHHHFAYLPFSAGGRNCIGQRFAMMEAKLILVPLIRSFDIRLAPSIQDAEFQYTTFITTKSKPGLKVTVRARPE